MAKTKQEMVFYFLLLAQLGWHGQELSSGLQVHWSCRSYLLPASCSQPKWQAQRHGKTVEDLRSRLLHLNIKILVLVRSKHQTLATDCYQEQELIGHIPPH
jgi:hypothetical protein